MRFNHALMENNITNGDIKFLIDFLKKKKKINAIRECYKIRE